MIILIVDDRPINLKLLRAVLEAEGNSILEAFDGVEALAILNRERVDAVITDILMPKMDGYRLCYEVRQSERLRAIPFIFYTATYTSPGDEMLCLELGADKYLRKPATAGELMDALHEVTKSARTHAQTPAKPFDEIDVMKEYSERLVAKLEEKNIALEATNAALSAARGQLEHLLAHSPAVIYSLKVNGARVVSNLVSENIARLLGFSVAEACSCDWWTAHLHPEDLARASASIPETLERGALSIEYRVRHKDGHYVWIEDNRRTVCDSEGRAVEIAGVWTDITARRQLEEQLRQSHKMEGVGQLAAGVAHDFNNLLTVINGRSQLLIGRLNPTDKMRGDLELIYKTGERAAALTRQLLAFSRRQVLEPVVLNLNDVSAEMDKMLRRLIREDIDLITIPDPALKCVKADPGQIEQILMNLVVNARDAMPNGGKLTIETANRELSADYCRTHAFVQPGHYVMLAVSDTGHGMDAAVKARIFEPFFTTKPQGQGTGLGLATVYGIVKQSGGHIEVYSEAGKGTSFKVYLPRTLDPFAAKSGKGQLAAAVPQGKEGKEVILVVEDEEGVRDLMRDLLEMNGYTVKVARNGSEALRLCQEQKEPIQLLLTDVVMPQMGGPELANNIKAAHPETKVLFTSGYTDHAIVRNGTLESGVAFIQKPFTPASLLRKVRDALERK